MKKTKDNHGLVEYQEQQRKKTVQEIEVALAYLRERNLPISIASVARESGLTRANMYRPHVQEYLRQQPEFNPDITVQKSLNEATKEYEEKIARINEQLKQVRESKKLLQADYMKLQSEMTLLKEKYQRLLGEYQIRVGDKIIPI